MPHSSTDTILWSQDRLALPHQQADKAKRVQEMFDRIAPTYEKVNTLMSAGQDRRWRMETVRLAQVQPTDRILDIACGTGDLVEMFSKTACERVVGVDFAQQMLAQAKTSDPLKTLCRADGLCLPFADQSFHLASCAFGVRNFQNLQQGLSEMYRVLKPGGRALILEFAMPKHFLLRRIYEYYFTKIMPRLATWVSRDQTGAYYYLPKSVKTFLTPTQMKLALHQAGFAKTEAFPKSGGIVYIYRADK